MAEKQDAKMQEERKLEEFRSFRISKRRTKEETKKRRKKDVKTQNCFVCGQKLK